MADEIQIEEMLEYLWMLEEDYGKVESMRMSDKFGDDIAKIIVFYVHSINLAFVIYFLSPCNP